MYIFFLNREVDISLQLERVFQYNNNYQNSKMLKKEQRTQKILSARDSLFKGCLLMLTMLFLSISATKAYNDTSASTDKAEEGNVTLQVTDALTGEPILGAVVKDSNGKTYVTNESGTCIMKLGNTDKKVKITVTFVGY